MIDVITAPSAVVQKSGWVFDNAASFRAGYKRTRYSTAKTTSRIVSSLAQRIDEANFSTRWTGTCLIFSLERMNVEMMKTGEHRQPKPSRPLGLLPFAATKIWLLLDAEIRCGTSKIWWADFGGRFGGGATKLWRPAPLPRGAPLKRLRWRSAASPYFQTDQIYFVDIFVPAEPLSQLNYSFTLTLPTFESTF